MIKNPLKQLFVLVVITTMTIGFVACSGSDDNKQDAGLNGAASFFIGNWGARLSGDSLYFSFSNNGNVVYVKSEPIYLNNVLTYRGVQKESGSWRYEEVDEHSGILYTTIDGWNTITILNKMQNYWNGISTSGFEITARKLADNDNAANHFAGSGSKWVACWSCYQQGICQTCSGKRICTSCSGNGIIGLGSHYEMTCSSCNGSGKCKSCNGSGKCSVCGGTGGHYE